MEPITTDLLRTPAGQALAIALVVRALRLIPAVTESVATATSVALGIGLSVYYSMAGGDIVVAVLNGLTVALAAVQGSTAVRHGYMKFRMARARARARAASRA